MIYEYCSSLIFCFLMSISAGYTIQTHSFSFLFTSCIVDMFEIKSKSLNILTFKLLFYICPPEVRRGTPFSSILQFFHEQRIQVCVVFLFLFFFVFFCLFFLHRFYSLHRQLIRMSNPPS